VSFVARQASLMFELHQKIVTDLLHPCCKPFALTTSSLMQKLKVVKEHPCFGNNPKSIWEPPPFGSNFVQVIVGVEVGLQVDNVKQHKVFFLTLSKFLS
jgi:hypothetical protein